MYVEKFPVQFIVYLSIIRVGIKGPFQWNQVGNIIKRDVTQAHRCNECHASGIGLKRIPKWHYFLHGCPKSTVNSSAAVNFFDINISLYDEIRMIPTIHLAHR